MVQDKQEGAASPSHLFNPGCRRHPPVLAPHVPAIRAVYDEVAALGAPVVVQRVHGDLHLGQTLRRPDGRWLSFLTTADDKDEHRRIGNRPQTVGHDGELERASLRPLPSEPFPTWLTLTSSWNSSSGMCSIWPTG